MSLPESTGDEILENNAKKILIVEDEDNIRSLIAATVSGLGSYVTLEARTGPEAVELAKKERPTLIFLDILLPHIDGFEVCRQIKSDPATRDAYVVMVTALTQERDRDRAREAGADEYITKPFSPIRMLEIVVEKLDM